MKLIKFMNKYFSASDDSRTPGADSRRALKKAVSMMRAAARNQVCWS